MADEATQPVRREFAAGSANFWNFLLVLCIMYLQYTTANINIVRLHIKHFVSEISLVKRSSCHASESGHHQLNFVSHRRWLFLRLSYF